MGTQDIKHEEIKKDFSSISNDVFEHIGLEINSITKIETHEEGGNFIICLPPSYEFIYPKKRKDDFKSDVKTLRKHFGISMI